MRRLFPLFLSLALLSGCGQAPAPAPEAPMTETAVLAAYEAAAEVYGWGNLDALPTTGDMEEVDGIAYWRVDYAGIETYADLAEKVRSLFAPALSDRILSESANYRDIGGRLYSAGGGRGKNLYMKERTFSAKRQSDDHWTVTLTFWADSWEWEQPAVTVGYSQAVVDYERTAEGWRFTTFCPSDDLDLDAETVFEFHYDGDTFEATDFDSWSDLQLALYLLHADGAYAEGPEDDLMHRFLDRPADILSLWDQLHADWQALIFDGIGHAAAAWLDPEGLSAFSSLLANVQPETDGETAALGRVRAAFEAGCA